jgi:hypothetical protein
VAAVVPVEEVVQAMYSHIHIQPELRMTGQLQAVAQALVIIPMLDMTHQQRP